MPFVLIVTDEPLENPAKIGEALDALETAFAWMPVGDGWIVHIESDHDPRDRRTQKRERDARYRERKRGARGAARGAERGAEFENRGAEISLPRALWALGGSDFRQNDAATRENDAPRGAARGAPRGAARGAELAGDTAPLTDDEAARGKRGIAAIRDALQ